jgi:hypothetical protein
MKRVMQHILMGAVCAASLIAAGAASAADTSMQEANKKAVVEFYEKGLNQKDFEAG